VAIPSMADVIFVALLAALLFTPLSVRLLGDAGIGWHIRTGQQILTVHAIPRVDPFSTQIQKPWIAWEWLYDVIVGWLEFSAGLNGVVWFTAVVIATVFAVLFRLLVKRGTNVVIALLLTLLAMSASTIHFLARPHVVSWLFALVWFWILDSTESAAPRSNWSLWLLPLLMLIWVNVHGGFLLGFGLLGVFWVGSLWTWLRLKESRIEESLQKVAAGKRARALTIVGLACAAASFINPYGWNLHAHIYSYLSNRFLMEHIEEFQSPNFHGIAQECFLLLLLIAIAAPAVRAQKLTLSGILVVLFAVYAGLYASRNIPVSSILLALMIGPIIPAFGRAGFVERMRGVDFMLRGHLWPIAATVATLMIAIHGGRAGSKQLMNAHFDPQRMPIAAVDFLRDQEAPALAAGDVRAALLPQCCPHGAVLSPDYWGGYLIYRLYPDNKVVIDDRHDFYGEWFLRDYLTMVHVEPGWGKFLQWRGACLLLPRKAALTQILTETPAWKAAYRDDVAVVFVRADCPGEDQDKSGRQ
jgi:hypothetical protein